MTVFNSSSTNGLALEKKTRINSKEFKTPTMMLTYSFRQNNPRPWKEINYCSVMTNSFDILKNGRLEQDVRTNGIHQQLELKEHQICAMDSGGYQFISRGEDEEIDPHTVINLQNESKTDIAVCLDYPLLPDFSQEKAKKLTDKALNNIKLCVKEIKNGIETMPVVHGTTVQEVTDYFNKVKKLGDFKIWGIGGLVPLMKQKSTSHKRYFKIIDQVMEIRKELSKIDEEALLHIFGVGSPLAGLLFLLSGADSIESISWIMNAKYFLVYQDKIGARKVSKKTTMCTTSVDWEHFSCNCPICNGLSGEIVAKKMQKSGNIGFQNRAMHNAYVYQAILQEAKQAVHEERLVEFCKEKLGEHRFFKGILKYTLKKIEKK
jgi:tRNA-guanine family transglycosylase